MPDTQNQNVYQQIQHLYEDLRQRGVFQNTPQAQALGHTLRQSGLIYDPTQGGLEPQPRPSAGMGALRMAEAAEERARLANDHARAVAASLDPPVLQQILNELGRLRANDSLNRAAHDLNVPVTMRPNGTLQALPQAVPSQAQQRINQALAIDAQRRALQQQAEQLRAAEAKQRPSLQQQYYRQIPLASRLSAPVPGAPQQSPNAEDVRNFLKQGDVPGPQTPPQMERLPRSQPRLTPVQRQLADVQTKLAKLGPESPVNPFDAAVGELGRRFLQTVDPNAFSTDPEHEALLNRLSFWQAIAAQPAAQSAFDYVFPGTTQVAIQTPGILGGARELALGVASPTNAAITAATMGANEVLAIPETLAALRSAQAETAFADVANTTADLVAARNAGDTAQQAMLQPLAEAKYGVFDGLHNEAQAYQGLSYRLAPLRSISNNALKYYYGGQGAVATGAAAADTDLLAKDPAKYWTKVGGQAAIASAPFVMPHLLSALDALTERARQSQWSAGTETPSSGDANLLLSGLAPLASEGTGGPAPFSPSGPSPLSVALRASSAGASHPAWSPLRDASGNASPLAPTPFNATVPPPFETSVPLAPLPGIPQAQGFPSFGDIVASVTGTSPTSIGKAGLPPLPGMDLATMLSRPAASLPAVASLPAISGVSRTPIITADTLPLFVRQALSKLSAPVPRLALPSGNEVPRLLPTAPAAPVLSAQPATSPTPAIMSANSPVRVSPASATQTVNPAMTAKAPAPPLAVTMPVPAQNSGQVSPPILRVTPSAMPPTRLPAPTTVFAPTMSQTPGRLLPPTVPKELPLSPSIARSGATQLRPDPAQMPLNQTQVSAPAAASPSESPLLRALKATQEEQRASIASTALQPGDWAAMPNGDRYHVENTSQPGYTLARSEADGTLTKLPTNALTPIRFEPTHSVMTQQGPVPTRATTTYGALPITQVVGENGQRGTVSRAALRPISPQRSGEVNSTSANPSSLARPQQSNSTNFARLIQTPDWFQSPQTRYPDIASVVRRMFSTVEEAEEYARSQGIQGVHYEQRLDIAQLANEFIARLKDRALEMPITMMVHSAYFAAKHPDRLEDITAMGDQGVILINPAGKFWHDPLYSSRTLFKGKEWSTPSPLHPLFHEHAHLFQTENTRGKPLTPKQLTLVQSVSIRARQNVDEFLAEVYTGLMESVQYDPDIMQVYRRLGGLKP